MLAERDDMVGYGRSVGLPVARPSLTDFVFEDSLWILKFTRVPTATLRRHLPSIDEASDRFREKKQPGLYLPDSQHIVRVLQFTSQCALNALVDRFVSLGVHAIEIFMEEYRCDGRPLSRRLSSH